MGESEDYHKKKLSNYTEHGQILMTCASIFEKFKDQKNLITTKDDLPAEIPKNFDKMGSSALYAEGQLKILLQVCRNIQKVNKDLSEDPDMQKKI
jgi:hypothetical protein